MVREITSSAIVAATKDLFQKACVMLPEAVESALRASASREMHPLGKYVLASILANVQIARTESLPLCQDTGAAILFVEIGQDVHISGDSLGEALQEGVRRAYAEGFLRKSICEPLSRKNTGDNTPAFIHYDIVAGDRLRIIAMPKGGGAENASFIKMLTPAEGLDGIKNLILSHISKVGANACPPLIIGIGIGATLETVGLLAKKALLRELGAHHPDKELAVLEEELLLEINKLGFGAGGYGGDTSALAVHIEIAPCHIASLPLALNVQCHAARHREVWL